MEHIEHIEHVSHESLQKSQNDVPTYTPRSLDSSQVSSDAKNSTDRRLESQLDSPEIFADRIKDLVDNTWPDEYA